MNHNDKYDAFVYTMQNPILYQPIGERFRGEVITICGSMKFAKEMLEQEKILTKEGYVVLMPVMDVEVTASEEELEIYRKVHKRKIEMGDTILVINKDGYVGRHTADEIEAASQSRKYIYFLENDGGLL